jgi:hypothetical protein
MEYRRACEKFTFPVRPPVNLLLPDGRTLMITLVRGKRVHRQDIEGATNVTTRHNLALGLAARDTAAAKAPRNHDSRVDLAARGMR